MERVRRTLVRPSGNRHATILAMSACLIILAAMLVSPAGIFANDSVARFGAGGIELIRSEHIRMLAEVLEISPRSVHVTYRFFNESDRDISTTVAFPLPLDDPLSHYYAGTADPETIVKSFKVLVNGRPIVTEFLRKAMIGDRDITDELHKLGFSDKEIFFDVANEDAPALVRKLEGFATRYGHRWLTSQTIFWHITFPAGEETVIEHEYVPATGHGYTSGGYGRELSEDSKKTLENLWHSFSGKQDKNEDCLDATTKEAIENRVKAVAPKRLHPVSLTYTSVEYILGTGRNWKGPIGEFTLRLVKEEPGQFVSVCFPGKPKKISPTAYEFYQRDFVPPEMLVVYFYTVEPGPDLK